jgi:putative flippase GtrA
VFAQTLLVVLYSGFGMSAVAANIVSSSLGAIPAYVLNRYWVWKKTSRNLFWSEVVPFWGMALLGLLMSTVFVAVVSARWDTVYAVSAASLTAFGIVWVGKYFVLHHVLFATADVAAPVDVDPTPAVET